jgi:hypothetical protein
VRRSSGHGRSGGTRFVPWVPNSFKVGAVCTDGVGGGGLLLANSVSVRTLFAEQYRKYLQLMSRRSYVWHYMESGAEMDDFFVAREVVRNLISEYDEVTRACDEEEMEGLLEAVKRPSGRPGTAPIRGPRRSI